MALPWRGVMTVGTITLWAIRAKARVIAWRFVPELAVVVVGEDGLWVHRLGGLTAQWQSSSRDGICQLDLALVVAG